MSIVFHEDIIPSICGEVTWLHELQAFALGSRASNRSKQGPNASEEAGVAHS
jgi:hypothetical protein